MIGYMIIGAVIVATLSLMIGLQFAPKENDQPQAETDGDLQWFAAPFVIGGETVSNQGDYR